MKGGRLKLVAIKNYPIPKQHSNGDLKIKLKDFKKNKEVINYIL